MEQIRRSLYCIGQLIWIQIWIQIDERCAGNSFLFNVFRRFGRAASSIQVPPPRYLNEEIRNVGCPAFLIFLVLKNTKIHAGGDFLLDERKGSVLWLVKRYTKHAAGHATGRKKW